jgi:hypothetical protein
MSSKFKIQRSRFVKCVAVIALVFLLAGAGWAQGLTRAGEAEGKMVFYAAFNATDSKTLIDGFKQVYPSIDATFCRATDAQLMERILMEGRMAIISRSAVRS